MASGNTNLETATALDTAALVRSGQISAVEACEAAIERIEAKNGPLNAVVVKDYDRARAAAKAVDEIRTADDARPLLGVPMTVKEANDVAGLPTTWGFEMFANFQPQEDSPPVARLKAAGAVILGKTNVPVALADWQSVNPVYGRTVNPYDHSRTPGGSSGGSAAALASGMVPLELGSDIGGSIRFPSNFCGVWGHKPTYGIVPLKGHNVPGTDGVDVPLAVVGPMARSAADLTAALEVVAGSLNTGWKLDLPAARHRSLKAFRILILSADDMPLVDDEVAAPIDTLADVLEKLGVTVIRKAHGLPDFASVHEDYLRLLNTAIMRGTPDARPIDAHTYMNLLDAQLNLQRQWANIFRNIDLVLSPAFSTAAFPHTDEPDWSKRSVIANGQAVPYATQLMWAGLATFPGLPSTAVPLARTSEGLPTGMQVVANLYEDRTTLAFAELLQAEGLSA
jgi:amidase